MKKAAKRLLAIDLGASGGKCFVGTFQAGSFTLDEVHRFAHEGVSFFQADRKGRVTERTFWDDTLLYRGIVEGLQAYRRTVQDRVDSIGIDTWGADGAFLSPDGDQLSKIYCYRDHRLDTMIERVKRRVGAERLFDITGIQFQPFNMSNQLHWAALNRPDLMRPGVSFLPIPSVFYYYLGGVKVVDSTWASCTQLMDTRTRRWSPEVLRKLGIPGRIMPKIVEPGRIVGQLQKPLADMIGIAPAPLVAVASHDTASAFAAAPVDDPSKALIISSGTWSLIGRCIPKPITTPEAMAAHFTNEAGVGNIRFLRNCMGTWLVQELRRVWRIADGKEMSWSEITRLAEKAPAFSGFIDPDDPRFYNPANMEKAIVGFLRETGQKPPAGRGALVRLVYESLAFKYRSVNEALTRLCSTSSGRVHVVGGGSRNTMLNQFTADALNLPVFAGPEEATAVGNLVVQAMGLGLIRTLRDAQPLIRAAFPIREYRPQATDRWTEAYGRFLAATRRA